MKNRTMARTVMVAGLCLVGGALTGCFGDCFSDVKTSITVADNIPITAGKSIRIRVVPDATGSDAQGIPIDNNSNSVSNISLTLADGVRSYEAVVKNQAWQKMSIYAYIGLFVLITGVAVVMGPCITALVVDRRKPSPA